MERVDSPVKRAVAGLEAGGAVPAQAADDASLPSVRRPARVLFLTACVGRGGAGNSLFYLIEYLDRTRFEPLVVMPVEGPISKKLRAHGVRYLLAPRLRERFAEMRFERSTRLTRALSLVWNAADCVRFVFDLARIIRREGADLVYCNQMMVKLMGAAAGLLTGRRVVMHCRTIYGSRIKRRAFNLLACLPNVKKIVAVSHAAAANFALSRHKVTVVHNGADLRYFDPEVVDGHLRRELNIPAGAPVVGFLGRIVRWKGIETLLEAAREVLERRPDAVFVLMGENAANAAEDLLSDYRRFARDRGMADRVLFVGFREDVRPYVKEMDLVVVPSLKPDPCPRSVIEALALGTPVVGTALGGIAEMIRDGENGFLVEPGDARGLGARILQVIEDDALRLRMRAAARRCAVERHDAAGVSRRVQQVLLRDVLTDITK